MSTWRSILTIVGGLIAAFWIVKTKQDRITSTFLMRIPGNRFKLALGGIGFLLYVAVGWYIFNFQPYLDDDCSALFQARIFASGNITLPVHQFDRFYSLFSVLGSYNDHHVNCSMYPPGMALLLLPGVLLGMPWLMVPLFGGSLAVATYILACEMFDEGTGRLAGILTLTSPFIGFMAGTFLTHVPTALFMVLCWIYALRLTRTGGIANGLAAGATWGVAFLCRPLTAIVVGSVIGLWFISQGKEIWRFWRSIAIALAMAMCAAFTLLAWQKLTTGEFLMSGYKIGMDSGSARLGFITYKTGHQHTPRVALQHTLARIRTINDRLLGWPLPSMLLVLWPILRCRFNARHIWLMLPWITLLLLYGLYWYWEEYWPARYTLAGTPFLIILAAQGWLSEWRANKNTAGYPAVTIRFVCLAVLLIGLLFNAFVTWPYAGRQIAYNPGDVERVLDKTLKAYNIEQGVVFMRSLGRLRTRGTQFNDYYATGFIRNQLGGQGRIVFARDLDDDNETLINAYGDGPFYLYTYMRKHREAKLHKYYKTGNGWELRRLGTYPKSAH